jgi:hypothetical protein
MVVANTPIRRKEAPRMCHSTQPRFRQQVQFLRRQFLQDGDLLAERGGVAKAHGDLLAGDGVVSGSIFATDAPYAYPLPLFRLAQIYATFVGPTELSWRRGVQRGGHIDEWHVVLW